MRYTDAAVVREEVGARTGPGGRGSGEGNGVICTPDRSLAAH